MTAPSTVSGYDGVALVAPFTVPYQRFSDHGAPWFIGQALSGMLAASGVAKSAVDGLAVASFTLAPDTAASLTEYFGLEPRWLEQLPYGGASGTIALRRAARAVQCGDAEIVACIGGDTNRKGGFRELVSNFSSFSTDAVYPYGAAGPNGVFAMMTRHYMIETGATREDFGRICIAQRRNAAANPHALLRDPLTLDAYLDARPVADPLHLFDCVMPCAGADGFLVMSIDRARSLNLPYARILAGGERHNAFAADPVQVRGGWTAYRDGMYRAAGVGPTDMDMLQAYDDYPVVVMMQLEGLGFCAPGEAPQFVRERNFICDGGDLPMNTSGGQLSAGQAGAAGGFIGMVEAIRQLCGVGLPNAVPGARTALVSGYGMVNYDRCLCTAAAIIEKGDA